MKFKRRKVARRILDFYRLSFGFVPPYQVLVDGTMLHAATQFKQDLRQSLQTYLGNPCTVSVTPGVLRELERLGERASETLAVARGLPCVRSSASESAGAMECVKGVIGDSNSQHFIVCTVDKRLADDLRAMPGVPVVYYNRDVLVLDHPSAASKEQAALRMRQKATSQAVAAKKRLRELGLGAAEEGEGGEASAEQPRKRKRKGPKGPNPLSVKKKQPKSTAESGPGAAEGEGRRRKIRRKRKAASQTAPVSGEAERRQ